MAKQPVLLRLLLKGDSSAAPYGLSYFIYVQVMGYLRFRINPILCGVGQAQQRNPDVHCVDTLG
jgi:hypothetical protein